MEPVIEKLATQAQSSFDIQIVEFMRQLCQRVRTLEEHARRHADEEASPSPSSSAAMFAAGHREQLRSLEQRMEERLMVLQYKIDSGVETLREEVFAATKAVRETGGVPSQVLFPEVQVTSKTLEDLRKQVETIAASLGAVARTTDRHEEVLAFMASREGVDSRSEGVLRDDVAARRGQHHGQVLSTHVYSIPLPFDSIPPPGALGAAMLEQAHARKTDHRRSELSRPTTAAPPGNGRGQTAARSETGRAQQRPTSAAASSQHQRATPLHSENAAVDLAWLRSPRLLGVSSVRTQELDSNLLAGSGLATRPTAVPSGDTLTSATASAWTPTRGVPAPTVVTQGSAAGQQRETTAAARPPRTAGFAVRMPASPQFLVQSSHSIQASDTPGRGVLGPETGVFADTTRAQVVMRASKLRNAPPYTTPSPSGWAALSKNATFSTD